MFIEGILYELTKARLGEHYSKYAVCGNCDGILKHHVDQKCLFAPTRFTFVKEETDGTRLADSR